MKFKVIVIALLAFSCNTQVDKKGVKSSDSEFVKPNERAAEPVTESIQSDFFVEFIRDLESEGYLFDTLRFNKSYGGKLGYSGNAKPFEKSGFIFYNVPLIETAPYYYQEKNPEIGLDFSGVKKIRTYYFASQTYNKGNKPDGIIEEWLLETDTIAKTLAKQLALEESKIYSNRGAYICYKENLIYIFHSRSVAYYDQIKPIFNDFISKADAIAPYENDQRKIY